MKNFWGIGRWIFLGTLLLVFGLMISKPRQPSAPLPAEIRPQLSKQFEQKLENLEQAKASGQSGEAEQFSAEEVNAGLQDMSATAHQSAGSASADDANVRIVGVNFLGNEAVGQFIVNRYGKDVYVTMSGHLTAKDGYANLELTSAKIGNLSVPVSLINPRLQERLAEPAQRERLKLPDFVADLRVENGKLVIVQK